MQQLSRQMTSHFSLPSSFSPFFVSSSVQLDPTRLFSTMSDDHNEVKAHAYILLLSNRSSMNINRFTLSFEEEGLYGLSLGLVQTVADIAVQTLTGLSSPKQDDKENQIVALAFAHGIADAIFQALGIGQHTNNAKRC